MSGPVRGLDISSWQHAGLAPVDYEAVHKAGYEFVIVKATQGVGYVNPWVAKDLDDARAEGLLVGAYHYYEAGVAAAAQALNFVTAVAGQHLDLGPWLDWECYAAAPYVNTQELSDFRTAVTEHLGSCGIYCDVAWAEILAKESVPLARLWLANWDNLKTTVKPLIVQGWPVTVAGITGPVDSDELLSTRGVDIPTAPPIKSSDDWVARLHVLAGPRPEEAPEVPEPDLDPHDVDV